MPDLILTVSSRRDQSSRLITASEPSLKSAVVSVGFERVAVVRHVLDGRLPEALIEAPVAALPRGDQVDRPALELLIGDRHADRKRNAGGVGEIVPEVRLGT